MKMLILPIKSSSVTRPIFILMASSIGRIVAFGISDDFLKSMVYANKPTTTQALKEEIGRCINEIPQHSCKTVIENFIKRSRACQQSRGGHLHDILFHT
ncbi:unnamed protein product [Euphydryas editha]|uniref:Uncharacterized protein n=1 Tax=Euphydryas editha TaxID=104508 RepID=A0AAU9TRN1_EUPED|nr:unnamed protein product [Euphydryas editha]